MNKRRVACLLAGLVWLGGCQSAGGIAEFTSDGCSLFPDGSASDPARWCDCCHSHDLAYWRGGTETQREQADRALRACVQARTGNSAWAELMYRGVRGGGSPAWPTWYRWGYGWSYGRGYQPLTPAEQRQADQAQQRYIQTHPLGYCGRP